LNLGLRDLPLTIDRPSWRFRHLGDYAAASYSKTAVALRSLEGLIGEASFATAMRAYVTRFRFSHPTDRDLESVFEEVTGEDLGWFFDQAVRGDAVADWAVLDVRNVHRTDALGYRWDGSAWRRVGAELEHGAGTPLSNGPPPDDTAPWRVEVDLGRRGEFIGPVEVRMRFADGSTVDRVWDGAGRWTRWSLTSRTPLEEVVVDPAGVWALETRRSDNYWRRSPRGAAVREYFWWVADALQLLSLLHLPWS
jgi:hypothetical protein